MTMFTSTHECTVLFIGISEFDITILNVVNVPFLSAKRLAFFIAWPFSVVFAPLSLFSYDNVKNSQRILEIMIHSNVQTRLALVHFLTLPTFLPEIRGFLSVITSFRYFRYRETS